MNRIADEHQVRVPAGGKMLEGILSLPPDMAGTVIFAHGSGSSRFSPRNRYVANVLHAAGIGTLLFDLLTPEEDRVYENRFDIALLAKRLQDAAFWLSRQPGTEGTATGYFGASTGSAAALRAAGNPDSQIAAIVSRGGRPDLAGSALSRVRAPVLLIVGGNDDVVIGLNREAYGLLAAEKEMRIIPGATHLFEEPGALEEVSRLAAEWFERYLVSRKRIRAKAS